MTNQRGPCIRCGCTDSIVQHNDDWQERGAYYWVVCLRGSCLYASQHYPSSEAAIAAWNEQPYVMTLQAEIAELKAIIAYIDDVAPRADKTCDEPGITLSEAVRRALRDGVTKDDFHG